MKSPLGIPHLSFLNASCVIVLVGSAFAIHTAACLSVTVDEARHVPAGLAYWRHGAFHVYHQNPPWAKLCAATPWVLAGIECRPEWIPPPEYPAAEDAIARRLFRELGTRFHRLIFWSRLTNLFYYVLGAIVIGRWSRELFGDMAGLLSQTLWCFSPQILGHTAVATPDIPATVLGLLSIRVATIYFRNPTGLMLLTTGLLLGLSLATKFSLLVLPLILLPIGFVARLRQAPSLLNGLRVLGALTLAAGTSLIVIWAVHGGGRGQAFAPRPFHSGLMLELQAWCAGWTGEWLGLLLPVEFLHGLDRQWMDVEQGYPNVFCGQFLLHGSAWYYPCILWCKSPLALWGLLAWAFWNLRYGKHSESLSEWSLALVGIALFLLHQFNPSPAFLRYLLPCYPLAAVWLGRVFADLPLRMAGPHRSWWGTMVPCLLTLVYVVETVSWHPQHLAFLQVLTQRQAVGWFVDSETDWGQDVDTFVTWHKHHPEITPLTIAIQSPFAPGDWPCDTGIQLTGPGRFGTVGGLVAWGFFPERPTPGYLAVSVSVLNRASAIDPRTKQPFSDYAYSISRQTPWAKIGRTICVYRVNEQ